MKTPFQCVRCGNCCRWKGASDEGRFWCIKIKDNGIGIPANEQKRLFKSHFRSSNAINSKITGSGIGLLLVGKLVKLHKGRIEMESKEGEGTCVTLHFPKEAKEYKKAQRTVSKPQAAHITDSHTTRPSNIPRIPDDNDSTQQHVGTNEKKKKLLVVEDNDELRTYLKHSLEEYIDYIYLFLISMVPLIELRGAMIYAAVAEMPFLPSLICCVIGNILPVPFLIKFAKMTKLKF